MTVAAGRIYGKLSKQRLQQERGSREASAILFARMDFFPFFVRVFALMAFSPSIFSFRSLSLSLVMAKHRKAMINTAAGCTSWIAFASKRVSIQFVCDHALATIQTRLFSSTNDEFIIFWTIFGIRFSTRTNDNVKWRTARISSFHSMCYWIDEKWNQNILIYFQSFVVFVSNCFVLRKDSHSIQLNTSSRYHLPNSISTRHFHSLVPDCMVSLLQRLA